MKIVIDVARNDRKLNGGWGEESRLSYLGRYVATYGVTDRLAQDFPEFGFTGARLVKDGES
jgi:hypothetical protein